MSAANDARDAGRFEPLSIEQLETGLRAVARVDTDLVAFWDQNVAAFRQTVLFAIRETSDALLSSTIPLRWRVKLEAQLEELVTYIALADRYIERRSINFEARVRPLSALGFRPH